MAVTITSKTNTLTVTSPAAQQEYKASVVQAVATISVFQQGIAGPPGTSSTTVILQEEPALTWTLVHDLNRYPSLTILTTSGEVMLASFTYLDRNTIQVTFGVPTNGVAYIN